MSDEVEKKPVNQEAASDSAEMKKAASDAKAEGKVMLGDDGPGDKQDEIEASNADAEHEVIHSDELSADVDVKKVTGSQRKLWGLVLIAVAMLTAGGVGFYLQLESGDVGVSAGNGSNIVTRNPEEIEKLAPQGTYAFVAKADANTFIIKNIDEEGSQESDHGASFSTGSSNRAFQLSSTSLIKATQTSNGILIKSLDEDVTLLEGQISSLSDWVLTPDGTRVYALLGDSLHEYDTSSGEGGEVSKNFTSKGALTSRLFYSRDGTLRQYGKSGSNIYSSIYDINTKETTSEERDVIRFDRIADFNPESLSPDGTALVFRAEINGNETLQLLSLNSYVLRTVYVADDPGTFASSFKWSQDSNNIIIDVAGTGSKLVELKVGTLQKEIILSGSGPYNDLQWSPSKQDISFVQGGELKRVNLESKEVTTLLESVSEDDITGWFAN